MQIPEREEKKFFNTIEVFEYYDFPRVFTFKAKNDALVLALSVEDRKDENIFIGAEVSNETIQSLKCHLQDLRSIFAQQKSTYLLISSSSRTGLSVKEIGAENIRKQWLPSTGEFLTDEPLPITEDISDGHAFVRIEGETILGEARKLRIPKKRKQYTSRFGWIKHENHDAHDNATWMIAVHEYSESINRQHAFKQHLDQIKERITLSMRTSNIDIDKSRLKPDTFKINDYIADLFINSIADPYKNFSCPPRQLEKALEASRKYRIMKTPITNEETLAIDSQSPRFFQLGDESGGAFVVVYGERSAKRKLTPALQKRCIQMNQKVFYGTYKPDQEELQQKLKTLNYQEDFWSNGVKRTSDKSA